MDIPADKVFHEIKGENGGKVRFATTDDNKVVIKPTDATIVVSKGELKRAAKAISDLPD